jgi:hypothetical protein
MSKADWQDAAGEARLSTMCFLLPLVTRQWLLPLPPVLPFCSPALLPLPPVNLTSHDALLPLPPIILFMPMPHVLPLHLCSCHKK